MHLENNYMVREENNYAIEYAAKRSVLCSCLHFSLNTCNVRKLLTMKHLQATLRKAHSLQHDARDQVPIC